VVYTLDLLWTTQLRLENQNDAHYKRNMKRSIFVGSLLLSVVVAACEEKKDTPKPVTPAATVAVAATPSAAPEVKIDRSLLVQFAALPKEFTSPTNPITKEKVELGRALFHDVRLSKNQDVSCNSCHDVAAFGVDNKATSEGHQKQLGSRNSPTVYNAAGHFAQFWDGRAKDVEEQAKGPVLNAVEMAMPSEAAVLKVLKSIPGYVDAFAKAFPGDKNAMSYDNLAKAIGAFERTLVVPSRFDKYVAGDEDALSAKEKAGLAKYLDLNCTSCHNGALLGGTEYKKLGLVRPWEANMKDLGRFQVTKSETDKMMFKTPSLRNVAKTAPYLHDGSVKTLEEAVKMMANHQLGKVVSDEDASAVAAFMGSFTGEPTAEMMRKPTPFPSSPSTPKPDPKK
jgi:cytochrome c peroxidase